MSKPTTMDNTSKAGFKKDKRMLLSANTTMACNKRAKTDNRLDTEPKNPSQYNIPTSNTYESLSQSEMEEDHSDVDATATEENTETPRIKIPPIIITSHINHAEFINKLKNGINKDFNLWLTREGTKVNTTDISDRDKVINYLKTNNLKYFTYALPSEKAKRLVAKSLPEFQTEDIISDLARQKVKCLSCTKLKQKSESSSPIYLLTFANDTNVNEIKNSIKHINYVKVKWDKYKNSRKITQCRKSQRFGHGTSSCGNDPRCVKCTGNHITADCLKTKGIDEPQCVNCNGQHPANYSKCPAYLKSLGEHKSHGKTRQQQQTPIAPRKTPAPKLDETQFPKLKTPPKKKQTTSFWETPSRGQRQSTKSEGSNESDNGISEFVDLVDEINSINTLCNISKMLEKARKLKNKLLGCKNETEQFQAFLDALNDG